MAKLIGGIGASHTPTIGFAKDHNKHNDPAWAPIFSDFEKVNQWITDRNIDVLFMIFNDHVTSFFFDHYSPFSIGVDSEYSTADEGGGAREYPTIAGDDAFARHIAFSLTSEEFDISTFQKKNLDHGCFSPLSMLVDGHTWQGKMIPFQVGVLQFPIPNAKRCYKLGKALRKAVLSYPEDLNVAIVATGGLSHQVHGERCGFNNTEWDEKFLDLLLENPEKLCEYRLAEYAELGGMEGAEVIMWLVMRGALNMPKCVHRSTYLPSMTNIATIIFEEGDSSEEFDQAAYFKSVYRELEGVEKLPGTHPFTVEVSHKTYRLNSFLHSLIQPEHRELFKNDFDNLAKEWTLSEEEINLVKEPNWIGLIHYGVSFFMLEKLGAVLGVPNPEIYASMRGETIEDFQKTRNAAINYGVAKA